MITATTMRAYVVDKTLLPGYIKIMEFDLLGLQLCYQHLHLPHIHVKYNIFSVISVKLMYHNGTKTDNLHYKNELLFIFQKWIWHPYLHSFSYLFTYNSSLHFIYCMQFSHQYLRMLDDYLSTSHKYLSYIQETKRQTAKKQSRTVNILITILSAEHL